MNNKDKLEELKYHMKILGNVNRVHGVHYPYNKINKPVPCYNLNKSLKYIKNNYYIIYSLKYKRLSIAEYKDILKRIDYDKVDFLAALRELNIEKNLIYHILDRSKSTKEIDSIEKLREVIYDLTNHEKINQILYYLENPIENINFSDPKQFIDNFKLITTEYGNIIYNNDNKLENIVSINNLKENISEMIVTTSDDTFLKHKEILIEAYNNLDKMKYDIEIYYATNSHPNYTVDLFE